MELMETMSLKFLERFGLVWCSGTWGSVFLCANLFRRECCCCWCMATKPSQSPITALIATGSAMTLSLKWINLSPSMDSTWEIAYSRCRPTFIFVPAFFPTHWSAALKPPYNLNWCCCYTLLCSCQSKYSRYHATSSKPSRWSIPSAAYSWLQSCLWCSSWCFALPTWRSWLVW